MKKLFLMGLFTVLLVLSAEASDWIMVFSNPDETNFVDSQSFKVDGDFVYYLKRTNITGEANGYKKIYGAAIQEAYVYSVENCKESTSKILAIQLKDAEGKKIMSLKTPPTVAFTPVLEETPGEKTHRYACEYAHQKKQEGTDKLPSSYIVYYPLKFSTCTEQKWM